MADDIPGGPLTLDAPTAPFKQFPTVDQIGQLKPPGPRPPLGAVSGETFPMNFPDGTRAIVPPHNVAAAQKEGGKLAQPMTFPDGSRALVNFDRVHEAMSAGGTVMPLSIFQNALIPKPQPPPMQEMMGLTSGPEAPQALNLLNPGEIVRQIGLKYMPWLQRHGEEQRQEAQREWNKALGPESQNVSVPARVGYGALSMLGHEPEAFVSGVAGAMLTDPKAQGAMALGMADPAIPLVYFGSQGIGGLTGIGSGRPSSLVQAYRNPTPENVQTALGDAAMAVSPAEGFKAPIFEQFAGPRGEVGGMLPQTPGTVNAPIDTGFGSSIGALGRGGSAALGPVIDRLRSVYDPAELTAAEAATKAFRPRNSKVNWQEDINLALPVMRRSADTLGIDVRDMTPDDALRTVDDAATETWAEYKRNHLGPTADVTVNTQPVADAMRATIDDAMREQDPGLAREIERVAATFDNREMTIDEVQRRVSRLNNRTRSIEAQYLTDRRAARLKPENEYIFAQRDTLRSLMDDRLNELTGPGAANLRRTYGALRSVEDVIQRRINVVDRGAREPLSAMLAKAYSAAHIVGGILSGHPIAALQGIAALAAERRARALQNPDYLTQLAFQKTQPTAPWSPTTPEGPRAPTLAEQVAERAAAFTGAQQGTIPFPEGPLFQIQQTPPPEPPPPPRVQLALPPAPEPRPTPITGPIPLRPSILGPQAPALPPATLPERNISATPAFEAPTAPSASAEQAAVQRATAQGRGPFAEPWRVGRESAAPAPATPPGIQVGVAPVQLEQVPDSEWQAAIDRDKAVAARLGIQPNPTAAVLGKMQELGLHVAQEGQGLAASYARAKAIADRLAGNVPEATGTQPRGMATGEADLAAGATAPVNNPAAHEQAVLQAFSNEPSPQNIDFSIEKPGRGLPNLLNLNAAARRFIAGTVRLGSFGGMSFGNPVLDYRVLPRLELAAQWLDKVRDQGYDVDPQGANKLRSLAQAIQDNRGPEGISLGRTEGPPEERRLTTHEELFHTTVQRRPAAGQGSNLAVPDMTGDPGMEKMVRRIQNEVSGPSTPDIVVHAEGMADIMQGHAPELTPEEAGRTAEEYWRALGASGPEGVNALLDAFHLENWMDDHEQQNGYTIDDATNAIRTAGRDALSRVISQHFGEDLRGLSRALQERTTAGNVGGAAGPSLPTDATPLGGGPTDFGSPSTPAAGAAAANAPVEPDLASRAVSRQGEARTIEFASTNRFQSLTPEEAEIRQQSRTDELFKRVSDSFHRALGIEPTIRSAYGVSPESGTENAIYTHVDGNQFDRARYANAVLGKAAGQGGAGTFASDPKGPDSLYEFTVPTKTTGMYANINPRSRIADISRNLNREGLPYHTIVPVRGGQQVIVFDQGGQMVDKALNAAAVFAVDIVHEEKGTAAYDTAGQFDNLIRDYESRHPEAAQARQSAEGSDDFSAFQSAQRRSLGQAPVTTVEHGSPQAAIQTLSPEMQGTNPRVTRGAEWKRIQNYPEETPARSYAHIVGTPGWERAYSSLTYHYRGKVPSENLYPFESDPDGLLAAARAEAAHRGNPPGLGVSLYEQAIKRAGYQGYRTEGNDVALFHNLPVQANQLRDIQALSDEARQELRTPAEQQRFRDIYNSLPLGAMKEAAQVGHSQMLWYERSNALYDALNRADPNLFPADARDRFFDFVSALSPRQLVSENMIMALDGWKEWIDNGRQTDVRSLAKSMSGVKGINLESRLYNAVRALMGEPISGFKVSDFTQSLQGDNNIRAVIDGIMNIFGGQNLKLEDPAAYYAYATRVGEAAKDLNWKSGQAQAAIWAWTQSFLNNYYGAKRIPRPGLTPEGVAASITPSTVAAAGRGSDFLDLVRDHPKVNDKLREYLSPQQMQTLQGELEQAHRNIPKPEPLKNAPILKYLPEHARRIAEAVTEAQTAKAAKKK